MSNLFFKLESSLYRHTARIWLLVVAFTLAFIVVSVVGNLHDVPGSGVISLVLGYSVATLFFVGLSLRTFHRLKREQGKYRFYGRQVVLYGIYYSAIFAFLGLTFVAGLVASVFLATST